MARRNDPTLPSEEELEVKPQPTVPNPGGRPSTFTQETADTLCAYLSMGQSLRTACSNKGMPAVATVFNWFRTYPNFLEQYTRAKEESADAMAEEVIDISDDGSNDWMERHYGEHTAWVTNGEALQRSRLRVETRKWLMAKMKPKKYGDKVDVTSGGETLGATVNPEQAAQLVAARAARKPADI